MEKKLNEQQLKSICAILADTNSGLTKSEIKKYLKICNIPILDDGSKTIGNGLAYQIGLNKQEYLYNCLVNRVNQTSSFNCVYDFIQYALNPIDYT